jgi:hypothetical protein
MTLETRRGRWQRPRSRPLRIAVRSTWSFGSGDGGTSVGTVTVSNPEEPSSSSRSTRRGGDIAAQSGVRRSSWPHDGSEDLIGLYATHSHRSGCGRMTCRSRRAARSRRACAGGFGRRRAHGGLQRTHRSRAVCSLIVSWMSGTGDTRPGVEVRDVASGFGQGRPIVRRRSGNRPGNVDVRDAVSGFGRGRSSVPRPDTRSGRCAARRPLQLSGCGGPIVTRRSRAPVRESTCATSTLASVGVDGACCDRATVRASMDATSPPVSAGVDRAFRDRATRPGVAVHELRCSLAVAGERAYRGGWAPVRESMCALRAFRFRPGCASGVPRPGSPFGSRGARRTPWR